MLNRVREPSGEVLEMTVTVETLVPGAELRQSGGLPGILTFDHRWLLEPVEGGTRVIQHEVDRGIGSGSGARTGSSPLMQRPTTRWRRGLGH